MTPVIFLDFDGVLIQADGQWSTVAMVELNRLCHETGAALVLSTSTRYSRSVGELQQMMVQHGFDAVIPLPGETRDLSAFRAAAGRGEWLYGFKRLSKGEEIGQWLAAHPDVDRFVILDDQPRTCAPYQARTVAPIGTLCAGDRMRAMLLLQSSSQIAGLD